MLTTPNLGLIAWNLPGDPYDSEELANNWIKLDQHDHTSGKGATITTAAIADGAITSAKLDPGAIPSLSISDGSVTEAKLAANAVTTSKIADGTIATADLADVSVATAKLANNAVTRAKTTKAFIQGKRHAVVSASSATVSWDVSFGDTNYAVSITFEGAVGPTAINLTGRTATTIDVALDGAYTGTIHAVGIHD